MKTIIIIIFLFVYAVVTAQVSDFHFNTGFITDMTIKNGTVAVLGGRTVFVSPPNNTKNLATVSIKKNGVWQNLPTTIERDGKLDSFYIWAHSKIQIDSKNNLWVTGLNGLYKYDGSKWSEFFIDDEFKEDRRYNFFLITKQDKFYLTTSVRRKPKEPIEFSELLTISSDTLMLVEKREYSNDYSTNAWPVKNNNFIELMDGSVLLAHDRNERPPNDYYDISKFNPDGSIDSFKMITFDNIASQKTPTTVYQHSDGTIWFSHHSGSYGKLLDDGSLQTYLCCSGVAFTNDLENWSFLGRVNGFPVDTDEQETPYSTYTIAGFPNGDMLIATFLNRLSFHYLRNSNKLVRKIDNDELYKNALLIPANDYPIWQQFYHNIVDTLRRDLAEQAGYIGNFQSIHFDNEGTMYLNFLGFLLEIPTSNITSVEAGVAVTDALRVFPNPAETSIRIEGTKEIRSVTATNILGSEVMLNLKGNNTFSISNLSTGLYTLLIQHSDNSISRSIFIKK